MSRESEQLGELTSGVLRRPVVSAHDHRRGPPDAPTTLVEYGDYQCPHCRFAHRVLQGVLARVGDQVLFVFRNFPMSEAHPYAQHAAEAAESVGAHHGEEKYWAMHDAIYAHQGDSRAALSDRHLVRYAEEIGADASVVARDLASGHWAERVRADFLDGVYSGVNGTPTFFIDGKRFDGNWSDPKELTEALERARGSRASG